MDVDYFKTVNDTFGHGVGDKVLKEIAAGLLHMAGDEGKVGRIGGDEFAVLIETPMEPQEMKRRLERFLEEISGILPDQKTSCSIGAYQFVLNGKAHPDGNRRAFIPGQGKWPCLLCDGDLRRGLKDRSKEDILRELSGSGIFPWGCSCENGSQMVRLERV